MTALLAVLAGGFAGAIARQELFSALQKRAGIRFPVGILAVNLSGAFVLGLLYGAGTAGHWPHWLATGAETGLIGAYTTYSTWAVDSLTLARDGAGWWAVVNLAGSLAAGVPLAWAGASLGSALLNRSESRLDHHELSKIRSTATDLVQPYAWFLRARLSSWPLIRAARVTSREEIPRYHRDLCCAGIAASLH